MTSTRLKHLPRVVCLMFVDICLERGAREPLQLTLWCFTRRTFEFYCVLYVCFLTVCSDGSEGSEKEPVVANCDLMNININQCLQVFDDVSC